MAIEETVEAPGSEQISLPSGHLTPAWRDFVETLIDKLNEATTEIASLKQRVESLES